MLSIKTLTRKDILRAVHYYADSADDYYAREGKVSGWFGQGSVYLTLEGDVTKDMLENLLRGHLPEDDENSRKFTRSDQKDRVGLDLTFSAPKSISLQTLVGGEAPLIDCHDHAVEVALLAAERYAQARHKVGGVSRTIRTENLVIARFRHETSRARDPQLHTHCVVMNMTRRPDGKWRVLKNDDIVKRVLFLGQVYREALAQELVKRGYKLRYDKEGLFELDHLTDLQIKAFSRRSQQVEEKLHQKGLTRKSANADQKQLATLESRARKTSLNREELLKDWLKRAKDTKIEFFKPSLELKEEELQRPLEHPEGAHFKEAEYNLKFAIHHLMERQAIVSEKDLLNTALKHNRGRSSLRDTQRVLQHFLEDGKLIEVEPSYRPLGASQKDPEKTRLEWIQSFIKLGVSPEVATRRVNQSLDNGSLILAEKWYTTQRAIAAEQSVLQLEVQGRGVLTPIMTEKKAGRLLKDSALTLEQQNAARMVLTTHNRVVGIQGFAGVGKSHLLKTCSQLLIAQGYEVEIIAPYNNQVNELKKLGVPSRTVISFLRNSRINLHPQKVLVVDEAGLVSTRLIKKLLAQVEKHKGRVVLLGDTMQLPAIEAGRPFAQLQKAGMRTLELKHIQRQQTKHLKKAVNLVARGHVMPSLDAIKNLTEIKSPLQRYRKIAQDYVTLEPSPRTHTMLLTGTNAARRLINQQVRDQLGLNGKGSFFDVLHLRDMTQAEKIHVRYYKVGNVIKLEKDYKSLNLKRDIFYEIQEIGPGNRLTVRDDKNQLISFNPLRHRAISVFEKERIEFSVQDYVRFISQDKKRGIERGDCFEIVGLYPNHILLKDKNRQIVLPTHHLLPLNYAYASTVHGSQGVNLHSVLLDLQTKSKTTDKNLYYVAISRARYGVRIYTDDVRALPTVLSKETFKPSALERVKEKKHAQELDPNFVTCKGRVAASIQRPQTPFYDRQVVLNSLNANTIESFFHAHVHQWVEKPVMRRYDNQIRYGTKGGFVVNLHTGEWYDHYLGKGGDIFRYLESSRGISYTQAIREVAERIGVDARHSTLADTEAKERWAKTEAETQQADVQKRLTGRTRAEALFQETRNVQGTLAEVYLRTHRHILSELPRDLRFSPSRPASARKYPALIAFARDKEGHLSGFQEVFLDKETGGKAKLKLVKKSGGVIKGASVKIQEDIHNRSVTFIAEGLETALSVKAAGLSGEILCGLGRANFKTLEPKSKTIVLCADWDGEGAKTHDALLHDQAHLQNKGYTVHIVWPTQTGNQKRDFNDVLKTKGSKGVRELFETQVPKLCTLHHSREETQEARSAFFEKEPAASWGVKEKQHLQRQSHPMHDKTADYSQEPCSAGPVRPRPTQVAHRERVDHEQNLGWER